MNTTPAPGTELPIAQPLRGLTWAARTLAVAGRRFDRDHGFEKAASLAYSSLLALVPAALLAVSVVELLDAERRMGFTDAVLDLVFPSEATEIRAGFHRQLEESRQVFTDSTAASVRIFSLVLLVYFAGNLLNSVDRVVRSVWGGGGFRAFLRRLSAYWAVVTLGPFLIALSFTATALASSLLPEAIGALLANVLPFVVTWFAVFLFYRLMPHSPVRSSAAVAGAVAAGTMWEVSKLALGWYLARPKTFMTTLSFFPAALLWMYVSWAIAVYGLEIVYVVHHRSWRGGMGAVTGPRGGVARDALTLATLIQTQLAFDHGLTLDRCALAERLRVPEDEMADAVHVLEAAGLIVADGGGWRPSRGAGGIRAADAIQASRGIDSRLRDDVPAARAALAYIEKLERGATETVAGATLADLVAEARAASDAEPKDATAT